MLYHNVSSKIKIHRLKPLLLYRLEVIMTTTQIAATQTTSTKLLTGTVAPPLEVSTLDGSQWRLSDRHPQNYTMVLFYRGLHCPICKAQLIELDRKLEQFSQLGIEAIAISGDTQERARESQQDWHLQNLRIGYGLSVEQMRRWGLYISKRAYANEPAYFNEPAIFFVKPDGTLAIAMIQSTPVARPQFDDVLSGLDYILKNNYPTRGTE